MAKQIADPGWVPRAWNEVTLPDSNAMGYIPIDASSARFNIAIGLPWKEFELGPRKGAIKGLIDQSNLSEALKGVELGKSISWVSVAAPPVEEKSEYQIVQSALINNTMFLIEQNGVERSRITAVSNDNTVPEGKIRVRIFVQ